MLPSRTPDRIARLLSRLGRPCGSAIVAAAMLIALLDAIPAERASHVRWKAVSSPYLISAGLYQGDFRLFAPEPDTLNTWVGARVTFADGSTFTWSTPDWQNLSRFQRFVRGRDPKFWDSLRFDANRAVWPHVAAYAARIAPRPVGGARPTRVDLIRRWWEVPAFDQLAEAKRRYGRLPPRQDQFPNQVVYHSQAVASSP
jgi:hypothetical protein